MTRINANIPPANLIDQHLLAEYREMVRIPNTVRRMTDARERIKSIPLEFVLGTGHVTYFYDKLLFLHKRFVRIKEELTLRGISNNMDDSPFAGHDPMLYNDIDDDDLVEGDALIRNRISLRISEMTRNPRYYGDTMSRSDACELLVAINH